VLGNDDDLSMWIDSGAIGSTWISWSWRICTAVWADGSGNVCGRPLGAHPHQQAPPQGISLFVT
jgi:hypothetical protein